MPRFTLAVVVLSSACIRKCFGRGIVAVTMGIVLAVGWCTDVRGAITVDGHPFFPFGLFCVGWTADDSPAALADAARLGCNTVHSYWAADVARSAPTVRSYLNEARRLGMKVFCHGRRLPHPCQAVQQNNPAP